ncbi:S8 family peptidase [Rossellomorea oryzaecorticis]|uniref:S8 family peptidase n=1 Tax=Rossellomorea oryzaecorticis TaxID=1396505 RepID=A0ABW8VS88_9BACI
MKSNFKKGFISGVAMTILLGSATLNPSYAMSTKDPLLRAGDLKYKLGIAKNEVKVSQVSKGEQEKFSKDQLIIHYRKPLSSAKHKKAGGKLTKRLSSLSYDVVTVNSPEQLEKAAKKYADMPEVESVTKSALVQRMAADYKASSMYHLHSLNVEKAQRLAGKHKVRVGIIDSGIEVNHPDLKNKVIVNKNAMNPLKKGQPDVHGTHVAGIIAANKGNGVGGFGIAPNSDIVSIDVFNRSMFVTDYTVAEGILEAIRQKVKVINMSLGTFYPSPIIKDAVKKATDAGIIVIASAGNDGSAMLNYPASFEHVISVGATNDKKELSDFSTFGKSVDVVAPGEQIYSTVFDFDKESSFAKLSGTSMSAPVVTGIVSLLLSKYPDLSPYEAEYIIKHTAKDLGEKGYDLTYGYGLIDPEKVLTFSRKDIPPNPSLSPQLKLKKAIHLKSVQKEEAKGAFSKPAETHYYKVDMKEGEFLQVNLKGPDLYDYKYNLSFFNKGNNVPDSQKEINYSTARNAEASLFRAESDGTLLIEVKDANGQYDSKGKSSYILQTQRAISLPEDMNTIETPVVLGRIPASTKVKNYFTEENMSAFEPEEDPKETEGSYYEGIEEQIERAGDSDYYTFSVPEDPSSYSEVIHVSVSAVAGMDESVSLYMNVSDEEEEEYLEMVDSYDGKGTSESEEAAFEVVPGQEYVLEVSNKAFTDEDFYLFEEELPIENNRSYSSVEPYSVSIKTTELPSDEDQYPRMDLDWENLNTDEVSESIQELTRKADEKMEGYEEETWEESLFDLVESISLPYKEGSSTEGHFQYSGDEDWYSFSPKHDGIYKLDTTNGNSHVIPAIEMYVYKEEINDLDMIFTNGIGDYLPSSPRNTDSYVGVKKGSTYFVRASDSQYRPSEKPYRFSLTSLVKNTNDAFESNESFDTAKKITTKEIQANFSSSADLDAYYFKPEKEGVYGVTITPSALPDKYKDLPKEVVKPIDPVVAVIEDSNGNGMLDTEEEGNLTFLDYGFAGDEERGAFRGKKGKGYFVAAQNYNLFDVSVVPYKLSIKEAPKKDEDAGSILKNKIPTKPIALRNSNGVSYEAGYMNMTGSKSDTDYYRFNQGKTGQRMFRLTLPSDLDGILSVYDSKGKLMGRADYYGKGDIEFLQLNLKKGAYYVKVEEMNGDASVSPYKLHVY